MNRTFLVGVAMIAAGFGLSLATPTAAPVHAAPSPLSPCTNCLPGPGGGPGGQAIVPGPSVLPVTGGGPKTGHPLIQPPGANTATPIGH